MPSTFSQPAVVSETAWVDPTVQHFAKQKQQQQQNGSTRSYERIIKTHIEGGSQIQQPPPPPHVRDLSLEIDQLRYGGNADQSAQLMDTQVKMRNGSRGFRRLDMRRSDGSASAGDIIQQNQNQFFERRVQKRAKKVKERNGQQQHGIDRSLNSIDQTDQRFNGDFNMAQHNGYASIKSKKAELQMDHFQADQLSIQVVRECDVINKRLDTIYNRIDLLEESGVVLIEDIRSVEDLIVELERLHKPINELLRDCERLTGANHAEAFDQQRRVSALNQRRMAYLSRLQNPPFMEYDGQHHVVADHTEHYVNGRRVLNGSFDQSPTIKRRSLMGRNVVDSTYQRSSSSRNVLRNSGHQLVADQSLVRSSGSSRSLTNLSAVHSPGTKVKERVVYNIYNMYGGATSTGKLDKSFDNSDMEEYMFWISEMLEKLRNIEYVCDLAVLEKLLKEHQLIHQEILDYRQRVDKAISKQIELQPEDTHDYYNFLCEFESKYDELKELSESRLVDLDVLVAFVRTALAELQWMNDRQEPEILRNWANLDGLDLPVIDHYYKQLLQEVELHEREFYDVVDRGANLLKKDHPAVDVIEAYLQSLNIQWEWLLALTKCLEVHLFDAIGLRDLLDEAKQIDSSIEHYFALLESRFLASHSEEEMLRDFQEVVVIFEKHRKAINLLMDRAKQISPLWKRGEPITEPFPVTSLVNYYDSVANIDIRKGDQCMLIDNSDHAYWTVRLPRGGNALVPSVIFRVPPPDMKLVAIMEALLAKLEMAISMWTEKYRIELARRRSEEEARRRAEEEARRRAEVEARRRAEEEDRRRAEEEARRRAEEEARRRAELEARRRAEEEARWRAEEEARRRADEEARRRSEEARRREEEERRRAEEARRRADDDARRRAEEEARLRAAQADAARERARQAEENSRRQQEYNLRLQQSLIVQTPSQFEEIVEDFGPMVLSDIRRASTMQHEDEMNTYEEGTDTITKFYEIEKTTTRKEMDAAEIYSIVEEELKKQQKLGGLSPRVAEVEVVGVKISLNEAVKKGYTTAHSLEDCLHSKFGIWDPTSRKELTIQEAIYRRIYDPDVRQLKDPETGELLALEEAVGKRIISFKDAHGLVKMGLLKLPPVSLVNAIEQRLVDVQTGEFVGRVSKNSMPLADALAYEYITLSPSHSSQTLAISLSDAIAKQFINPNTGEFLDTNSGERWSLKDVAASSGNRVKSSGNVNSNPPLDMQVKEVVNTVLHKRVDLRDAIAQKVIDPNSARYDPGGSAPISIGEAYRLGYIQKPMSLKELHHRDLIDSAGRFIDPATKQRMTLIEAVAASLVDPDVEQIWDVEHQHLISISDSLERGIMQVDGRLRGGPASASPGTFVGIPEAVRSNMVRDPVKHTVFEIKGVRNTRNYLNVSFNEAVKTGIILLTSEKVLDVASNEAHSLQDAHHIGLITTILYNALNSSAGITNSPDSSVFKAICQTYINPETGKFVDILQGSRQIAPQEAYQKGLISLKGAMTLEPLFNVPSELVTADASERTKERRRTRQVGAVSMVEQQGASSYSYSESSSGGHHQYIQY